MYKSSMRVSELLSLARDSADVAPAVDDGYYLMWLGSLESLLYTGVIRECGVYTCTVEDGEVDISLIEESPDCALPRECDIREIFLDGRQFVLATPAEAARHPERSLFYMERGVAHLSSPYGVTGTARLIYLRRPAYRGEDSLSEFVALPDEFLPMALDYLVGCAYALVCEDTQAANRFAAYNASLDDFVKWQEKNKGGNQ